MSDAMKAPWQDVKEEAADELAGFERQRPVPGGTFLAVVFDAEGDVRLVEGEDAPRGDGDTVGVAGQVGENGLRPGEGGLGIDDPTLLSHRGEVAGEGLWLGEMGQCAEEGEPTLLVERGEVCEEETAEQRAENPHRQEECGTRSDPA